MVEEYMRDRSLYYMKNGVILYCIDIETMYKVIGVVWSMTQGGGWPVLYNTRGQKEGGSGQHEVHWFKFVIDKGNCHPPLCPYKHVQVCHTHHIIRLSKKLFKK